MGEECLLHDGERTVQRCPPTARSPWDQPAQTRGEVSASARVPRAGWGSACLVPRRLLLSALPPRSCPRGCRRTRRWESAVKMRRGSWPADSSARSRNGSETGHIPGEETNLLVGQSPETGTQTLGQGTQACPCIPACPAYFTRPVTHQVTKFYGGHGCLEDGPEAPEEMGSQSIPEG